MTKLTPQEIKDALGKYESGLSLVEVGQLFNVSGAAIGGLLIRRGIPRRTLSKAKRVLPCNHAYFNEPLDEARAYWIGFILADGAIVEKSYGVTSQFAVVLAEKDRGHLEKLKAALDSEHKIVTVKRSDGRTGVRFAVSSAEMADSLIQFNIIPRKSGKQIVSDLIPSDFLPHYFRGYFDGNGSISRSTSSKWNISNVSSEEFLCSFLDWIDNHIGGNRPSINFSDGVHRVQWSGTHRCKEILDLMYEGATVYLDRKKMLYDAICEEAEASPRGAYNRK